MKKKIHRAAVSVHKGGMPSVTRTCKRASALAAAGFSVIGLATSADATNKTWTGATSITYGTAGNWSPGGTAAGSLDVAIFSSSNTVSYQPTLGASAAVGGIWATGGGTGTAPYELEFNTKNFTLDATTLNGNTTTGIEVDSGNTLILDGGSSSSSNEYLSIGAAQSWLINGTLNFQNFGNVSLSLANALTIEGSGTVAIPDKMNGSGALTIDGSGTVSLAGSATADTYTGQLTIESGTLKVDAANNQSGNGQLGASANTNAIVIGGTGTTGTLEYAGTSNAGSNRTITLAAGGTAAVQVDSSSATLTLSGNIGGSGAMLKTGAGGLLLGGTGTFTGGLTINAGTLNMASATAIPATGTVSFTGGILQYSVANQTDYSTQFSTAANQLYRIDSNSQTVTFSSALTSSGGSLTKYGLGTLILATSNSYSGGTTVSEGTLTDSPSGVAGAFGGGSVSVTPTGTLSTQSAELIANSSSSIASTAAVIVNNNAGAIGTVDFTSAAPTIGSLSGTGNVVLNGASGTALTTGTAGNPTFSGVISDSGGSTNNGSLTVTGSGTFTLAGTSTYFGSTNVSGGTLNVTGAVANSSTINVNASAAPANLVLAGASAVPAAASITGTTGSYVPSITVNVGQSFASLANAGTTNFTAGTSTIGTVSDSGTMLIASIATLNAASSFNENVISNAGTININGGASNAVGTVNGAGTLALTGANLTAAYVRQGYLSIDSASTVTIADSSGPGNTAATSVLTELNNGGTLDLKNNDLIVLDTTQYTAVRALINNAADGGAWDLPGITSSSARANNSAYGLGYAQASTLGSTSFDGQSFTDAVLVKYTLLGDTQLRGAVGIGDYDTVLNNFGTGTDWSQGNFHYGGTVGIGDYDDVLNNFGATATGNLANRSALTRGLSPAVSLTPNFAKADLKLEVNTVTGDVYALANTSVAFIGYTVSDPSAHLLGGSTSPDPAKLLSVSAGNGGNTNVFETAGTYVNWNKITEVANQIAEGQSNNGYGNHSSRDDTISIPSAGTIDFGDIYNTTAGVQDITFNFAEAAANGNPTGGPAYYGAEVDYVTTPEPAALALLGFGSVMMLRKRRHDRILPRSCR